MSGRIYSWDGNFPVIDPTAFVRPEAVVIGDVLIGPACYVGPGAVLHGCRIGRNAMVGMNAVLMDEAVVGADSIFTALQSAA